jgi:hypothetical protein
MFMWSTQQSLSKSKVVSKIQVINLSIQRIIVQHNWDICAIESLVVCPLHIFLGFSLHLYESAPIIFTNRWAPFSPEHGLVNTFPKPAIYLSISHFWIALDPLLTFLYHKIVGLANISIVLFDSNTTCFPDNLPFLFFSLQVFLILSSVNT